MRKRNADTERQFEGTISDRESEDSGTLQIGGAFSETENSGGGGDGLFTPLGFDPGGSDAGDSVPETRSKRGRPKGSKNARKSTGTAGLAAARAKLADALSGVVGFGISYYGTTRAKPYKTSNPRLAYEIYACYQIPPEAAKGVGEPIADAFVQWFPQYVEPAVKGVDPALAIWRLSALLQQCSENEKLVVARSKTQKQEFPSTNGAKPPETESQKEEPIPQGGEIGDVNEWMSQHPQTPADIQG